MIASCKREVVYSCGTSKKCPFYRPTMAGLAEKCWWNEDYECTNQEAIKTVEKENEI